MPSRDDRDRPRFEYRQRSEESVRYRAKQQSGVYDSYLVSELQSFKPSSGENCIRILPPTWLDDPKLKEKWGDHWGIDIFVHYGIGPDRATYLCLDKMKGERCPICEARTRAVDEDESDQLRPNNRILCWLIDRNDEKTGPKIWAMPLNTSKDISGRTIDKRTGEILPVDAAGWDNSDPAKPIMGYDVFFDREGEKKRTKYVKIELDREPTPLHNNDSTADKWLEYIQENPLYELLNFHDAAYIEKVLMGRVDSRSGDDGDRQPERGGDRRRPRPEPEGERERDEGELRSRRGGRNNEEQAEREEPRGRGERDEAPRRGRGEPPPEETEATFERPSRRRGGEDNDPPSRERSRERTEREPETEADPPFEGGRRRTRGEESGEREGAPRERSRGNERVSEARERVSRLGSGRR